MLNFLILSLFLPFCAVLLLIVLSIKLVENLIEQILLHFLLKMKTISLVH